MPWFPSLKPEIFATFAQINAVETDRKAPEQLENTDSMTAKQIRQLHESNYAEEIH